MLAWHHDTNSPPHQGKLVEISGTKTVRSIGAGKMLHISFLSNWKPSFQEAIYKHKVGMRRRQRIVFP